MIGIDPRVRRFVLALLWALAGPAAGVSALPAAEAGRVSDLLARLPLAFEPNVGQAAAPVRYLARGPGYQIVVAERGVGLRLGPLASRELVWIRPIGGRLDDLVAEAPFASASTYQALAGTVPLRAPHHRRVRAAEVWPGIDLVLYGRAGALEYDFELAPGTDVAAIELAIDGASLDDSGALLLGEPTAPIARFAAPVAYQLDGSGARRAVASRYLVAGNVVRFALGEHDPTRPLVIDPVLVYSTYLGGGGVFSNQEVDAIAAGPNGEAYVAGITESASFPIEGAGVCDDELNDNVALAACNGSPVSVATDAFVAKIAADGATLVYSTYLGGEGWDRAQALAVNAGGEAWVAGDTWDGLAGSTRQAFLVRMNAAGSAASFATVFGGLPPPGYLGLEYGDAATSLVLDGSGNVYVGGWTASVSFHPAGVPGLDQTYGGAQDGFVQRYTSAGVLTHSTYAGGPFLDDVRAVDRGSDGSVFVAGKTFDQDQAFGDIYILRLGSTLTNVVAGSTLIAGTNGEETLADITVDGSNRVWLVGETTAANFCTGVAGGIDHVFAGPSDGYAFRIDSSLASVDLCTFAGGPGCDRVTGVALSADGITLVGGTQPGALDCSDDFDLLEAFVLRLDPAAAALRFTYALGGPGLPDQATAVAIGSGDRVLVGGLAGGPGFPVTPGALQTAYPSVAARAGFVLAIDPTTRLSIDDASTTEGNSGTKNLGFTVRLNGFPLDNVGFTLATANGTATAGSDYVARNQTCPSCFLPLGAPTRTENVVIQGDTTVEPNETFTFALSAPTNAVLLDGTATGTIVNDDAAGSIRFSVATYTVGESGGSASTTLQRTGGTSGAVSVTCATVAGGTATAGQDYTTTSTSVSWANGDSADKTCAVPILGDTGDEANETVNLALSNPTGGASLGAPSTAALTITDDDPLPAIAITDVTVTEGSSGTTGMVFSVALDRTGYQTATVAWATANGTAIAPGDYGAGAGTLTFTAGQTAQTITRLAVGDTLDEANETFTIGLSSPTNATVADAIGVGTITDDDTAGTVQFQTATSSVTEGSGTSDLVIARSGGAASAVTVAYAVSSGTASGGGVDFTLANGMVTFGAGETTKNVAVAIVQDTLDEANETIVVTLSNPGGGASLGPTTVHTRTIADDDVAGSVQFQTASASVSEGTGATALTITRSGGAASAVTVAYAVSGGTASGGGVDYTLANGTVTFGAGEAARNVAVTIVQDSLAEANETLVVTLSNPGGGATLGAPSTHTLTIVDDEGGPLFVDGFESGDASAWSAAAGGPTR